MNSTSIPQQRWTLRAEYVDQPLGCIVDYFWDGFEVGQRIIWDGMGYMEIKGFEVLPEDVMDALVRDDTLTRLYAMHDAFCVPMHGLEPVLPDAEYGDWRVTDAAWALVQSVEVAA